MLSQPYRYDSFAMVEPRFIGRYEILAQIGKGAMGVVYKARDPRIDRIVVLKTLRPDILDSEDAEREFLERFSREARAAGKLSHPSIVTVHDVDRDAVAGLEFIAMEYVAGASLQELLAAGGRLPADQVVDVGMQVAEALDYAHGKGVIHRDIKPANLILREDGVVKITDFGIARLETSELTRTGEYVGTPHYMSPEQVIGEPVDGRSDQFALAIVLYQMLTGVRPFGGDNLTTITYKIVHEDPLPPSQLVKDVAPSVSAALLKGLAKEREDRYPDCRSFVGMLEQALMATAPTAEHEPEAAADELARAPATVVRGRAPRPEARAPVARAADDRPGDLSSPVLSLSHEMQRLSEASAIEKARLREALPAAPDEDDATVFEVDPETIAGRGPTVGPSLAKGGSAGVGVALAADPDRPALAEALVPTEGKAPVPGAEEATRDAASPAPSPPVAAPVEDDRTRVVPSEPRPIARPGTPVASGTDERTTVAAVSGAVEPGKDPSRPRAVAPVAFVGGGLLFGFALLVAVFATVLYLSRATTESALEAPVATDPEAHSPAVEIPATPVEPPALEARHHFEAGVIAYEEGRLDDAERELAEALRLDPSQQAANDYLSLVLARQAELAAEPVTAESAEDGPRMTMPAGGEMPVNVGTEPSASVAVDGGPEIGRPASSPAAHPTSPSGHHGGSASPLPPGEGARGVLALHFDHVLKNGRLIVSIGETTLYDEPFQSSYENVVQRRLFGTEQDLEIELPTGEQAVTIRVVAPHDHVDTQGTRHFDIRDGKSCRVVLGVGRVDRKIEISKHCQ